MTAELRVEVIGLPAHVLRNIAVQDDGCWHWTRSRSDDGYGWASLDNRTHQAHRLVYMLLRGEPPAGSVLDHLCRVRHCVNPDHLEPVTPATNLRRSPIAPAGQSACLRCGSPFAIIRGQRRCPTCLAEYEAGRRAKKAADERARRAARKQVTNV